MPSGNVWQSMSWIWALSHTLPKGYCFCGLPQGYCTFPEQYCSYILYNIHYCCSKIWEYWEHSSLQDSNKSHPLSPLLQASSNPWYISYYSYSPPNPSNTLSSPKSSFQIANMLQSPMNMKSGITSGLWGHHSYWWLSGKIPHIVYCVFLTSLSLSSATGYID